MQWADGKIFECIGGVGKSCLTGMSDTNFVHGKPITGSVLLTCY